MAQIPANLPPSLQLLLQKQQEHSGLQALREASGDLVKRVEKLAESTNVMADGGKGKCLPSPVPKLTPAIGDVMQNWSYVWTILEQLREFIQVVGYAILRY